MEYKIKPMDKSALFYILGLIVTGVLFWIFALYRTSYVVLFQLVSVALIGAGVYILIRYRLTVFRVVIDGKNGADVDLSLALPSEVDLVVEKMRGNRGTALARLSFADLKCAEYIRTKELAKRTSEASLFKYYADISPEEGCLLIFGGESKDIAIFTMLSPEMLSYAAKMAEKNKIDPNI